MSEGNDRDRTQVTQRPQRTSAPGYGQQLNGRYEIGTCLEQDVYSLTFEGYDPHEEERVVIRVVHSALVPTETEAETVARRLREAVGIGGAFLSPIIDAGREGLWAYTVEMPPKGASLRTLLNSRLAGARPIQPGELLPVIARIDAGLRALPPPWHHGDIRPERVFFTADGLKLAGAFLVPALPPKALMQAWSTNPALRERRRADVSRGSGGDATDRYGVGLLAHEAILGRLPQEENPALPRRLGDVGSCIAALLVSDSRRRAESLNDLIGALADAAGSTVPQLDPRPYRRVRRQSQPRIEIQASKGDDVLIGSKTLEYHPETESSSSYDELSLEDACDSVESIDLHIAELVSESVELDLDNPNDQPTAPQKALNEPALDDATVPNEGGDTTRIEPLEISLQEAAAIRARQTGLDPRLVRAALRPKSEEERGGSDADLDPHFSPESVADPEVTGNIAQASPGQKAPPNDSGSLDPRLVRAALAMVLEDESDEVSPELPSTPQSSEKDTNPIADAAKPESTISPVQAPTVDQPRVPSGSSSSARPSE